MKGYKAFNPDMTCRGMQYEVGKTYVMDEEPILCKRGYHFCETIAECSLYYKLFGTNNRVCEVEASGTIKYEDDKCVTNQLFIGRELSRIEINRELYRSAYGYSNGNGYGHGYGYSYGNGNGNGEWGFGGGFDADSGNSYCEQCDSYNDNYGNGEGCGFGDGEGDGYCAITKIVSFN